MNSGVPILTTSAATVSEFSHQLIQGIGVLERLGIIDFNGHFSVRLPDGRILINSGDSVRSALTPADFVSVGPDGELDPSQPRPPAELPLHLAVYKARPDVKSVVHGHPKWSTLLTSAGHPYEVTLAQGALLGDIPVFPSPRSVNNEEIAGQVAETLGQGKSALLRAHGSVVAADDVLEATVMAIYLELNAERQVLAAPLGGGYVFSEAETEGARKGLAKRGLFEKCWNYYIAKFDLG
jgi:L-fuculose-phosphate aldolase